MIRTKLFGFPFYYDADVNVGNKRSSNQDVIVCQPDIGFFAVSDGMGGLAGGAETSSLIAGSLSLLTEGIYKELCENPTPKNAGKLLAEQIELISNNIYDTLNNDNQRYDYGATFCGVWLVGKSAVFVNIGDSRGYILKRGETSMQQITNDHNVAAVLISNGELTEAEARNHKSSNSLTKFVGMKKPAMPDKFCCRVDSGDKILICSDGLYGMIEDSSIVGLMKLPESGEAATKKMIDEANAAGGRDNISAVYIEILS